MLLVVLRSRIPQQGRETLHQRSTHYGPQGADSMATVLQ